MKILGAGGALIKQQHKKYFKDFKFNLVSTSTMYHKLEDEIIFN